MKKINITLILTAFLYSSAAAAAVLPLLSTTWNQGCYYNASCPIISGGPCGRAYTGCNATALAQIMRYWQHPAASWGGVLTAGSPPQTVDFNTATYDWLSMPASLSGPNAETAKIMLHAGVAVDMAYGSAVSNSFFNSAALKKYFKYSIFQTFTLKPADDAAWKALLKADLDAGRVIFVKGGDHFYLIDGYDASDYFHCNFGWGGAYDGYYDINSVVPGGYNVTPGTVVTGIKPLTALEASPDTITAGAGASSLLYFEFAALNSWTIATDQAWLAPFMTSGPPGYYDWQTGAKASVLANPAYSDRYGSLTITSGAETAVIIVKQSGIVPVLVVTPALLNFSGLGGTLSVTVTCETGWTAATGDGWISIVPPAGTGNGVVDITTASCGPVPRTGSVIFTRGGLTQTVTVEQAAWGATWCVPALVTPFGNGVTRVALNTLDRVSAWDEGYINTGMGTTLNAGSSYTLNVTFYGSNAPAVWIDWNQNGLFTDPGEAIMPPAGAWYPSFAGTKSISVSVPATAVDGLTRMRIYAKAFGSGPALGPCATTENGGCIEDYDIFVINPPTPTATATVTATFTHTPTILIFSTATHSITPTVTETMIATATVTRTISATSTRTKTASPTTVPTYCVDIDTTFNATGAIVINGAAGGFGADGGYGIRADANNKVIIAGYGANGTNADMIIHRYNENGTLDTSFNTSGKVKHDNAGGSGAAAASRNDYGYALAIDNNGNYVVAGSSNSTTHSNATAWRYNTTGAIDMTFGGTGYVNAFGAAGSSAGDQAFGVAVDGSNRVIMCGYGFNAAGNMDMVVYRYTSAGALDATFNSTGSNFSSGIAGGTGADIGNAVAIDASNRVIIAGGSTNAAGNYDIVIWRYTEAGVLDTAFNTTGYRIYAGATGGADLLKGVKIDSDGKIVATGQVTTGAGQVKMVVMRLNDDGSYDTTFGSGTGMVMYNGAAGGSWDSGASVWFDANGRILIGGLSSNGSNNDMTVWRLLGDGSLDIPYFNNNGYVTLNNLAGGSGADYVNSVTVDQKNRIMACGTSFGSSANDDIALWRAVDNCSVFNTATVTASATFGTTNTITETATPQGSATMTATFTNTKTETESPTVSSTGTESQTATHTRTATDTGTASPTGTETQSPTLTLTLTATFTRTDTATVTQTGTYTPTQTITGTHTDSPTQTETWTASPAFTHTATPTATRTATITETASVSPVASSTETPVVTMSSSCTYTPSSTMTVTMTGTQASTASDTVTATFTQTQTLTASFTMTITITMTRTLTVSMTPTCACGSTATMTPTSYIQADQLIVFPCPASTAVTAGIKDSMGGDKVVLTLFTNGFRKILSREYPVDVSGRYTLDVSYRSNGVYALLTEIYSGNKRLYRHVKTITIIK